MHQLPHQIRKRPIRLHQLGLRTDKTIRHLPHTSKKRILENPIRLIHPIAQIRREMHHLIMLSGNRRNLRHHNPRLGMFLMHHLDVVDRRFAVGAVVMDAEEIGRVIRDAVHEVVDPFLAVGVAGAGRADEFLALVAPQGEHLLVPDVRGVLWGDACAFRLVEEEDDVFLAVFDVLPVPAGELGFEMDHWRSGVRGALYYFFDLDLLGRKGARPFSSGGTQVFQLQTEDMGPLKSTLSIICGTPLLPGPSVLVQS